jgi:hypothetical protein
VSAEPRVCAAGAPAPPAPRALQPAARLGGTGSGWRHRTPPRRGRAAQAGRHASQGGGCQLCRAARACAYDNTVWVAAYVAAGPPVSRLPQAWYRTQDLLAAGVSAAGFCGRGAHAPRQGRCGAKSDTAACRRQRRAPGAARHGRRALAAAARTRPARARGCSTAGMAWRAPCRGAGKGQHAAKRHAVGSGAFLGAPRGPGRLAESILPFCVRSSPSASWRSLSRRGRGACSPGNRVAKSGVKGGAAGGVRRVVSRPGTGGRSGAPRCALAVPAARGWLVGRRARCCARRLVASAPLCAGVSALAGFRRCVGLAGRAAFAWA